MTTQTALPTVRITKTMKQKMKLYGVQLRKEPSTITHLLSGRTTKVSPSVFALFEIAAKANYVAFMLYCEEQQDAQQMLATMMHYKAIFRNCSPIIEELPYISDEEVENRRRQGPKHSSSYLWAVRHLQRLEDGASGSNLYYLLLD